jgi:hypothetical protein
VRGASATEGVSCCPPGFVVSGKRFHPNSKHRAETRLHRPRSFKSAQVLRPTSLVVVFRGILFDSDSVAPALDDLDRRGIQVTFRRWRRMFLLVTNGPRVYWTVAYESSYLKSK